MKTMMKVSFNSSCEVLCAVRRHLEEERVGVLSQLSQQLGLRPGVGPLLAVLQGRVHLAGGQVQLAAEGDAHHVHVVSAVAKGAGQGDEDWRTEDGLS